MLIPLLVGLTILAGFTVLESQLANPLLPLGFFRNRIRAGANLATLFFASGFFAMLFLLTLYCENVQHWSPLKTGLAYLPFGLSSGLGVRTLIGAGFPLFAGGLLLLARITVDGSYLTEPLGGLVLMAIGAGFSFAGLTNAALQQVGGAVGLAVLVTTSLRHTAGQIAAGTRADHATVAGYVLAFRIGAVLVFVLLDRGQGRRFRGRGVHGYLTRGPYPSASTTSPETVTISHVPVPRMRN